MDYGSLIQAGLSLYGSMKSKKNEGRSLDSYQDGLRLLQSIVPPSLAELSVQLQQAVQEGQITPEEYIAFLQEETELNGIKIPEEIKKMQYEALTQMSDIANNGGLDDIDKAKLNEIKGQMLSNASGLQKSTQQQFASRGMTGSGLEAARMLSNDSANIEAASRMGFDVAAEAQRRAMDAIKNKSSMASQIRGQEYGEQADKARAQDAINNYNTRIKQSVSDANIRDRNAAEADNLRERQRISDMNTGIRNQEATQNAGARQQVFNNEISRVNPQVNQGNQIGREQLGAAARDENQWGNIANAAGRVASDYFDKKTTPTSMMTTEDEEQRKRKKSQEDFDNSSFSITSDERCKQNISQVSDDEIDELFNKLTSNKFNYKTKYRKDKNDPQLGVMAQDMEKSPLGSAIVIEVDGVKKLDGEKALSAALSAIASHSKRLKKIEGRK